MINYYNILIPADKESYVKRVWNDAHDSEMRPIPTGLYSKFKLVPSEVPGFLKFGCEPKFIRVQRKIVYRMRRNCQGAKALVNGQTEEIY